MDLEEGLLVSKRRSVFLPSEETFKTVSHRVAVSKRRSAFLPSEALEGEWEMTVLFLSAEAHFFLQKFRCSLPRSDIVSKRRSAFLPSEG